jgi:hypothetical protein
MNEVLEEQAKGLNQTGEAGSRNDSSVMLSQRGSANSAREALWDAAESIVTEFVKADAPQQVNIGHHLRSAIIQSWGDWSPRLKEPIGNAGADTNQLPDKLPNVDDSLVKLFAHANKEVYELLRKDGFQRWKATPAFTGFITSLRQSKDCLHPRRLTEVMQIQKYALLSTGASAPASAPKARTGGALQGYKESTVRLKQQQQLERQASMSVSGGGSGASKRMSASVLAGVSASASAAK